MSQMCSRDIEWHQNGKMIYRNNTAADDRALHLWKTLICGSQKQRFTDDGLD